MNEQTLYMKCTTDKYELPIAVEDSPSKLAARLGMKASSVMTLVSKERNGYHKVKVERDMWPDNDGNLWFYDERGKVVVVE